MRCKGLDVRVRFNLTLPTFFTEVRLSNDKNGQQEGKQSQWYKHTNGKQAGRTRKTFSLLLLTCFYPSAATCQTYHCYKGGPAEPPEGLETGGCPLHSHPAQLVDNKNCVLCMDCLKACPHTSVEFNLRPPGVDLWTTHKPTVSEIALMFMLLGGGVFFVSLFLSCDFFSL